ncbi:glycosyltransferase family 4 protein [Planctomycetota bacterium]|nr:glycosyltransferase family 4 protein [Planctomycetota bacterium]
MKPRILLLLPQSPFDNASGAAVSSRTIAETLAANNFTVQTLCPTTIEKHNPKHDHYQDLINLKLNPINKQYNNQTIYHFTHKNVEHTLLKTSLSSKDWQNDTHIADTFEQLLHQTLTTFKPHIVMTYGGSHRGPNWLNLIKQSQAALVLLIHNLAYKSANYFNAADLIIVPSQFTADHYHNLLGSTCTPLPIPINPTTIIPNQPRDPIFLTMINPSPEKGLFFAIHLAHHLATKRPDIPILFVESRATAGHLLAAAKQHNIDLTQHESIMVTPQTDDIRDIYQITRTLIMPSIIQETGGRVAAEALINAIPTITSDRGALPETVSTHGFPLPLPKTLNMQNLDAPITPQDTNQWLDLIIKLTDDQAFYTQASQNAKAAIPRFSPETFTQKLLACLNPLLIQIANPT